MKRSTILKSTAQKIKVMLMTAVCMICIFAVSNTCFSKELKEVAVLPFVINSQENLDFLKKGIFDMFSSRMAYADEVKVLTRETLEQRLKDYKGGFSFNESINEAKARDLGDFLNVDHVLFGSLTLFGNSMSLDVKMVDITQPVPALTFFRQADNAGAVIPQLDKIAEEINYKVFGRMTEEFQSQQMMAQTFYQGSKEALASPLSQYETLFQTNNPIEGMASGDVDGDGKDEVAVIYGHTLEILKMGQNRTLSPYQKVELSHALVIVGVDIADINKNGSAEIFVSCVNPMRQEVSSSVIEHQNGKFSAIVEGLSWYFRVIHKQGKQILVAQESGKEGPYTSKRVFQVQANGVEYISGETVRAPHDFSVMGYVAGNVFHEDREDRLFTDNNGRLKIFDDTGRVEWASEKGFGGSLLTFKFNRKLASDSDYSIEYFQPRNLINDADGDGKNNLITIRNNNKTSDVFKGFREFNYGYIEIMEWNDLGLMPSASPKKIPGQITDINIIDSTRGQYLLVSFVKKRQQMFDSSSKSMIIAYKLGKK